MEHKALSSTSSSSESESEDPGDDTRRQLSSHQVGFKNSTERVSLALPSSSSSSESESEDPGDDTRGQLSSHQIGFKSSTEQVPLALPSTSSSSESESEDSSDDDPQRQLSSHQVGLKSSTELVPIMKKQNGSKNTSSKYSDKEIKLSSSLQPGKTFDTYLNIYPHLNPNEQKNKLRELSLLKLEEMKDKNKRAQPGFEKQLTLPPYFESRRKRRREGLKERDKTKGARWFNMPATELTEELKNDLAVLQMRGTLDPKQFYKRGSEKICPKYFQVGTIIESPAEFYSSRIPKKQRKKTLVDELLSDVEYRKYQKKKYAEIMRNQVQKRLHASQKRKMKQKRSGSETQKKHKTKKTKN